MFLSQAKIQEHPIFVVIFMLFLLVTEKNDKKRLKNAFADVELSWYRVKGDISVRAKGVLPVTVFLTTI